MGSNDMPDVKDMSDEQLRQRWHEAHTWAARATREREEAPTSDAYWGWTALYTSCQAGAVEIKKEARRRGLEFKD